MYRLTRRAAALLACCAVLAVAACGDDSSGPSAPEGTLTITNASDQTILIVNFSTCDDPSWGDDRLGASETIAPGASRSWDVAPGCYDVRARVSGFSAVWFDQTVTDGNTLTLSADEFPIATVVAAPGTESLVKTR